MLIHPQEALLQQARALPQRAAYDEYRARRVVVEHRLVQLVQRGIRQSRYCGRAKTRFQLYLATTVANLTLVLGNIGCPAVPAAAQQATASSSRLSALLSPMPRPTAALPGSDNYGP